MPQAWDSLKLLVSISFVVLSKFQFSKLWALFTGGQNFCCAWCTSKSLQSFNLSLQLYFLNKGRIIFANNFSLFNPDCHQADWSEGQDCITHALQIHSLFSWCVHCLDPPPPLVCPLLPLLPHGRRVHGKVASLLGRHHLDVKYRGYVSVSTYLWICSFRDVYGNWKK